MESEHQIIQELTTLFSISQELASCPDLDVALVKILAILDQNLGLHRSSILLVKGASDELSTEIAHGLSEEEKERGRFKKGEGITGMVLESGEPVIVPDISLEPRFLNRTGSRLSKKEKTAFIAVPLIFQGRKLGVLSADRSASGGRESLEEDVRLLTTISSIMAQAVLLRHSFDDEKRRLQDETTRLEHALKNRYTISGWIGRSKLVAQIAESVHQVAASRATVLILGESGTGKEVIAKAIHFNSPRSKMPFIQINCAAIPETLLESELFGHEKGAFTGASLSRPGRFEAANEGTIFLDEIGEIPPSVQVKLLRVLQERVVERIGSNRPIPIDVRIVAATNRNLDQEVRMNRFREDLYYRLNVIPIYLPPLRHRKEDIPLLLEHFRSRFIEENGRDVRISSDAIDVFMEYDWPGNVRELENIVERLVVMARKGVITASDVVETLALFPVHSSGSAPVDAKGAPSDPGLAPRDPIPSPRGSSVHEINADLPDTIREIERERIVKALERSGGVKTRAALALGITTRQLVYRMEKYGIRGAES